jgi:hypothetical protein
MNHSRLRGEKTVIAERSSAVGPLSPPRARYHLSAAAQVHEQKLAERVDAAIGSLFRNHWIVAVFLVGMGLLFRFGG